MACSLELSITNLVFLGVIVFAAKKAFKLFQKWRLEKMLEKYANTPKDKVVLHSLWRCKTVPSISPYALKLETYLRMAKIPYEMEFKDMMGPKGKLPWISYNGTQLGDSHLIIQFLNKKLSIDLNKDATKEQVSVARACRLMLEEHFLWGPLYYRSIENFAVMGQIVTIPPVFKFISMLIGNGSVKKRLETNGIGLHTPTEIYQMTEDDLRTCSTILGKNKFFGGDKPCEDDAAIFGGIAQVVWATPGSTFERLVHGELVNLKEYCERMRNLYYPDWEEILDKK